MPTKEDLTQKNTTRYPNQIQSNAREDGYHTCKRPKKEEKKKKKGASKMRT